MEIYKNSTYNICNVKFFAGHLHLLIVHQVEICSGPSRFRQGLMGHHRDPITQKDLIETFDIPRTGWMKKQGHLFELGLIKHLRNPRRFIKPVGELLTKMYHAQVLSRTQYQLSIKVLVEIIHKHLSIMGTNQIIEIAFCCLYATNNYTFAKIAKLFNEYEEIVGNGIEKRKNYLIGRRAVVRVDLKPLLST